tara:strand:- start:2743 stop:2943 length:201 start_codon:yes stop_codon:yes gene_type:complete
MPYKVVKVTGGYKVGLATATKMSNGRLYLSNKPLTKKEAINQKIAVDSQELQKTTKKKKKPKTKKV